MTATNSPEARRALLAILSLNVLMSFANYFVFDFPQALEEPLIRKLHISTIEIGFLYAIYALPNILCSPLSGYMMEKAGLPVSALSFTALIFLGHLIVTLGIHSENYPLVVVGRGLYGIGGEGLVITQPTINEYWFSGSMLSVSNGVCQSLNFVGIMLGNYLVPKSFQSTRNILSPFYLSCLVNVASSLACILYVWAHFKWNQYKADPEAEDQEEVAVASHLRSKSGSFMGTHPHPYIHSEPINDTSQITGAVPRSDNTEVEFGFSSIKGLSLKFWLCGLVFLLLANCFFQFTNIASDLVVNRYGYAYEDAKSLTILPSLTIIFATPFISHWLQVNGHKAIALFAASVLYLLVYSILYFLPSQPSLMVNICLMSIGLGHSTLLSTIYTCVGLSVPRQGVGMAYSLMAFIENFGLTLFPIILSSLSQERTPLAYNQCVLALGAISLLSALVCGALVVQDFSSDRLLDYPENSLEVAQIRVGIEKIFTESKRAERLQISSLRDKLIEMKELPETMAHTPDDGCTLPTPHRTPINKFKYSAENITSAEYIQTVGIDNNNNNKQSSIQ